MKKKTQKQLKDAIWRTTSKIVRSSAAQCYTCDKPLPYAERSAGHFWSKGGHGYTRFNLDNLRVQCVSCNSFKSGNLAEYATRLLAEIGQERYDILSEAAHSGLRHSNAHLEDLLYQRTEMLRLLES